jgi:hypothetical protein
LETTLSDLSLTPDKSLAWRSKNYTYNYIFKNLRKSLMTTLKTTTSK